ncbi:MAG TPA: shikimate dehydrogenase [Verrucomicrobia bacterium]|nr:MAG: shikimate dehydrogenase [Lentisphaerae bacterium GWF2_57_35]HBA84657.1 shikimate dehydrogenase [Verrucomicrobiota bacterium]
MKIGGQTKKFAVLGHPIGHTLSPVMHNAAIQALDWDAIYLAFDVHPDQLMNVLPAMQQMGFGGVNLTVPLKETAFKGLSRLDESARIMGAVNTVKFEPEGPKGYNTDGMGFLKAMEEAFGEGVAGKRMFVFGAGGAGRAVALAAAGEGVRSLALADVDIERCRRLAVELETQFMIAEIDIVTTPEAQLEAAQSADIIVQATPVGMKTSDPSPLPPQAFHEGQRAFDLVYMYPETAFMKAAKAGGARIANGLGMLLHQGAKAFEIWTGVQPPVQAMRAALEKEVYKK